MKLEGDKVVDHIGTVLAEKIRGEWHTKDPAVLDFINNQGTETEIGRASCRERV